MNEILVLTLVVVTHACYVSRYRRLLNDSVHIIGRKTSVWEDHTVLHASLWQELVQQPAVRQLDPRQTMSPYHYREQLYKYGSKVSTGIYIHSLNSLSNVFKNNCKFKNLYELWLFIGSSRPL